MIQAPDFISQEDFEAFLRMRRETGFFARTSVRTWDEHEADPLLKASKPFPRYAYLERFFRAVDGHPRIVVNKSRQLIVSWALAVVVAHELLFHTYARALVISKTQEDSYQLRDRVRHIIEQLPWAVQHRSTSRIFDYGEKFEKDKAQVLAVEGHSEAVFLSQSRSAGRGYPATLVIADEIAFWQWAREIYTGLVPTTSGGACRIILSSTPNGVGALHTELFQNAEERGFKAVRLHYSEHPDRDPETEKGRAWAEAQKKALGPRGWAQEHDCAFLQSGRPVFDAATWRRRCLPMAEALRKAAVRRANRQNDRTPFLTGVDVGEGYDDGDWTVATVIEKATGRQAATARIRAKPDIAARFLKRVIFDKYPGVLGIEKNGPGGTFILACEALGLGARIYRHREFDERGIKKVRVGWVTSSKSKPIMIDELDAAVREGEVLLSDETTLAEGLVYEYKDIGHSGAPEGYHDDSVIAAAIAWQMRKAAGQAVRPTD